VHYVGMNDEQQSTSATFNYVAAPSYEAPYVFPTATPAAPPTEVVPPLEVASRQGCRRSRCRRNRHLRLPVLMLLVSLVMGLVAITHTSWFHMSVTVQSSDSTVTASQMHLGLFKGCSKTSQADSVEEKCFNVCHGGAMSCKKSHALAAVAIASASFTLFALVATLADRCGCFGSTRKVWVGPVCALFAVALAIATTVIASHSLKDARHHHQHQHQPNESGDTTPEFTVLSVEKHLGVSFWLSVLSMMSSIYAFLFLAGHACRTRCKLFRQRRRLSQIPPA